jgi:hypothetical protein
MRCSLAFCLSLSGDELCAAEMRRQELSGSVQCGDPFVEDWIKGLVDVRHPSDDIEGDVGGGGLLREADGVVEEDLACARLTAQR